VILELPTENREEIAFTRSTRDPLEFIKKTIIDAGFADAEELKDIEKRIRKQVQNEVIKAKESPKPPMEQLMMHILAQDLESEKSEYPPHIRMPNYAKSYWASGKAD
jgi:pyruvate dehydrogenase E1 component alpha subunit